MHYLKPKLKKINKLGILLPGLKNTNELKTTNNIKKISEYGKRLNEKQKIKYNFGLSEIEISNYIQKLYYNPKINLLLQLEVRLDNIIYKLGFAKTIISAKQLINHGKIYVNEKKITFANFNCKKNDLIQIKLTKKQKLIYIQHFKTEKQNPLILPTYLIKKNEYCGIIKKIPNQNDIKFKINERLIIEFFGKK